MNQITQPVIQLSSQNLSDLNLTPWKITDLPLFHALDVAYQCFMSALAIVHMACRGIAVALVCLLIFNAFQQLRWKLKKRRFETSPLDQNLLSRYKTQRIVLTTKENFHA